MAERSRGSCKAPEEAVQPHHPDARHWVGGSVTEEGLPRGIVQSECPVPGRQASASRL